MSRFKYLLVILALLASLYIYHGYRDEHTVLNIIWPSILDDFSTLRIKSLPAWVVFSLPEALWVFAATVLSADLYLTESWPKIGFLLLPLLFGLGLELLQLLHITDGVFDILDIWAAVLGFVVALLLSLSTSQSYKMPTRLSYGLVISSYGILILADVVV